jgi:hypothetical protein
MEPGVSNARPKKFYNNGSRKTVFVGKPTLVVETTSSVRKLVVDAKSNNVLYYSSKKFSGSETFQLNRIVLSHNGSVVEHGPVDLPVDDVAGCKDLADNGLLPEIAATPEVGMKSEVRKKPEIETKPEVAIKPEIEMTPEVATAPEMDSSSVILMDGKTYNLYVGRFDKSGSIVKCQGPIL